MSDIQSKVFNVIAATVAFIVFCFASSWILFEFKGSSTSLKDTWSIVSSLFGGIATLAAAYIASLLFNDWRAQERVGFIRQLAYESSKDLADLIRFMMDFDKKDPSYLSKLKTMHSLISVNLDVLDKNLAAPEISHVNKKFTIFLSDFLDVVSSNIDNDQLLKIEVRKFVKTFSTEYNCLTRYTILSNIPDE